MAKNRFKLFIYALVLVVLFLGLVSIITKLAGKAYILELVGIFLLLLLTLFAFFGYTRAWGERIFFFIFLLYMLNLVSVWYFKGPLYLILLFLAILGFILAFPKKCQKTAFTAKDLREPHSEIFDVPAEDFDESAGRKTAEKTVPKSAAAKTAATKYSPGKFVASKASNTYHEPKCDWAKKIKKHRLIWFKSKEEAWEKGYKAHSCVH